MSPRSGLFVFWREGSERISPLNLRQAAHAKDQISMANLDRHLFDCLQSINI